MDTLRVWIISLISVTIICTVIEKFAPDGSLSKYVKLACGLVVTVVIAGPVIKFLSGDFNIEELAWKDYITVSEGEMKDRISRLEEKDSKQLLEVYRQSLVSDIKARYEGEKEFMISEVDAVLQEDSKSADYGAIRELYIKVGPPPGSSDALFGLESESRLAGELSQTFGVDRNRVIIDSSVFEGR